MSWGSFFNFITLLKRRIYLQPIYYDDFTESDFDNQNKTKEIT